MHERCRVSSGATRQSRRVALKEKAYSWWRRAEIEEDLLHMKEKIQSLHLRLISFSTLRTEHSNIILRHELRQKLDRIDQLYPDILASELLEESETSFAFDCDYVATSVELQFFEFQIWRIIDFYKNHRASPGSTLYGQKLSYELLILDELYLNSFKAFLSVISLCLKTLRERPELAYSGPAVKALNWMAAWIDAYTSPSLSRAFYDCALAVNDIIFSTYDKRHEPSPWLTFWPHQSDSGVETTNFTADFWRRYEDVHRKGYSSGFLTPWRMSQRLCDIAHALRLVSETDKALDTARDALALHRVVVSNPTTDTAGRPGGPSPTPDGLAFSLAVDEAYCLEELAQCLAAVGSLAEARAVGSEALTIYIDMDNFYASQLVRGNLACWNSIIRNPCSPVIRRTVHGIPFVHDITAVMRQNPLSSTYEAAKAASSTPSTIHLEPYYS
ncbi:hypothetical protein HGRIS_005538 [Hohenbuehelia grisea]